MWELVLMKPYLFSLGAGILVGIVYSLLNVRSPAPPVIALVGLLGILAGEQIPPLVRQWLQRDPAQVSWVDQKLRPHMFGHMPGCEKTKTAAASGAAPEATTARRASTAPAANAESHDA